MLPDSVGGEMPMRQKGSGMKQHLTIKELPDSEKPYEKFLSFGAESLSDAELLAVIIKSGTNGTKSIEVAQDFLNCKSRNLLNLYDVSLEDMRKIRGIGKVKAIQLKCIAELSARITRTRYQDRICLNSAKSIAAYYMESLRHEKQEKLMICMFDTKCRLIDDTLLSVGDVRSAVVSPREIFLTALRYQAVHIVLLHNHPSGLAQPSGEDDAVTKRIFECGKLMGILLSDHIIIGDNSYYSYREQNQIT